MNKVILRNVNKYFNKGKSNEIHVINNVNIELPSKGLISIYGKSGCGKTTLLNAIGGLDDINNGQILIDDKKMSPKATELRNLEIGYIFQNYNLIDNLNVFDNVAISLKLLGIKDEKIIKSRVMKALKLVKMEKFYRRYPDTLSGGQQQRIAIARVIVKNPKLILADEPTGNLDSKNTLAIMNILRKIANESLVILVTHEEELVSNYSDRVIEIVDGKINNVKENIIQTNEKISKNKEEKTIDLYNKKEIIEEDNVIELFGNISSLNLKIIEKNGQYYLKSSQNIQIINSLDEIGIQLESNNKKEEKNDEDSFSYDLEPVDKGKKIGNIFNFKECFKDEVDHMFFGKKSRLQRFLKILIFGLSFFLIITSGMFGTYLKSLDESIKLYKEDEVMLKIDNYDNDYETILKNDENITDMYVTENGILDKKNVNTYLYFNYGNFKRTDNYYSNVLKFGISGAFLSKDKCENLELVAGKKEILNDNEIIVSTGACDKLLNDNAYNFLHGYESFIGCNSTETSIFGNIIIKGVVKDNNNCVYVSKDLLVALTFSNKCVAPERIVNLESSMLNDDEIYLEENIGEYNIGDKIYILGKQYTIVDTFNSLIPVSYDNYLSKNKNIDDYISPNGQKIAYSTLFKYLKESLNSKNAPEFDSLDEFYNYFYNKYLYYYKDYLKEEKYPYYDYYGYRYLKTNNKMDAILSLTFREYCMSPYVVFDVGEYLFDATYGDIVYPLGILSYYQKNGTYPNDSNLIDSNYVSKEAYYDYVGEDVYKDEYDDIFYKQVNNNDLKIVFSNNEFTKLSLRTGKTENNFYFLGSRYKDDNEWGSYDYSFELGTYFFIKTKDVTKTVDYLAKNFGRDNVFNKKDIVHTILTSTIGMRDQVVAGGITILVLMGIIAVCMYFVKKAESFSKIKRIGIYRAIGTSKKNIVYKDFISSVFLTFTSCFFGILLGCILVYSTKSLGSFSAFYLPLWLLIILIAFLFMVNIFFGILPTLLLLRKSPQKILSKYDI